MQRLLQNFPSMLAAAETLHQQQQAYLDFLQTPAHYAAYHAAQNSQAGDFLAPPLNRSAIIDLPQLEAAVLELWLSLAQAQQLHPFCSSRTMQRSLQQAVQLARKAWQHWEKPEVPIIFTAGAILGKAAEVRDDPSRRLGGPLLAATAGAMLDVEKARSFIAIFRCPCCDDDMR